MIPSRQTHLAVILDSQLYKVATILHSHLYKGTEVKHDTFKLKLGSDSSQSAL